MAEDSKTNFQTIYVLTVGGVFLSVVAIFGIIANGTTIFILSKPQMKSSLNYLLIGLTLADTVTIFSIIWVYVLPNFDKETGLLYGLAKFLQNRSNPGKLSKVVYHTSRTVSIFLTLAISIERYIAVRWPFKARHLCTCKRALIIIASVIIFAISSKMAFFLYIKDGGIIYLTLAHRVAFYILYCCPALALIWLNVLIYLQIRKINRERKILSNDKKKEVRLTVMLLWIVIVFIGCNSFRIVWTFSDTMNLKTTYHYFAATDRLMVTIYTSSNFILYSIFGQNFKEIFVHMCRKLFQQFSMSAVYYSNNAHNFV